MQLDLVIVGYNDSDFHVHFKNVEKYQRLSGAYRRLVANTSLFYDERLPHMELLGRMLKKARGGDWNLNVATLPNPAVYYLKSYVHKRGFNSEIVNFYNHEKKKLASLLENGPLAVALTTTFYVEPDPVIEMVKFIRSVNPNVQIIVGGTFIYNLCEFVEPKARDRILDRMGADIYVFEPQGEKTLCSLLSVLKEGEGNDLSQIPNLVYPSTNGIYRVTERQTENNSLVENGVNWSLFDPKHFTPSIQTRTAINCAFKCSFCSYHVFAGKSSLAPVEVIEKEFRQLKSAGVRRVSIIDDTFNVPLPRFKEICRMMIRNQFDFEWFSYFRCANADEEAFDLLAESGCKAVHIGLESGDQGVLRNMNKKVKVEAYSTGIREINKRGIKTLASIIVGFPGETKLSIQNTIDLLKDSPPTFWHPELFFYDVCAPIKDSAAEHGLTGLRYSWTHNTMKWQEACDHLDEMVGSITDSLLVPDHGFGIWAIPYLLDQGLSMDQIVGFVREAGELIVKGVGKNYLDAQRQEERLLRLLG